jgi:uncharacterized membrane protein
MNPEISKYAAEIVASSIELFASILIGITIVILIVNNLFRLISKDDIKFNIWKKRSWKGIQGSLDLFVASDLLSTITIDRTLSGVVTLGILLIIRTLISWSIEMEAEGCWPWQKRSLAITENRNSSQNSYES